MLIMIVDLFFLIFRREKVRSNDSLKLFVYISFFIACFGIISSLVPLS